jgi:hypothetical protein
LGNKRGRVQVSKRVMCGGQEIWSKTEYNRMIQNRVEHIGNIKDTPKLLFLDFTTLSVYGSTTEHAIDQVQLHLLSHKRVTGHRQGGQDLTNEMAGKATREISNTRLFSPSTYMHTHRIFCSLLDRPKGRDALTPIALPRMYISSWQ